MCSHVSILNYYSYRGFRIVRLQAISQILAFQAGGDSELCMNCKALDLTAACVWLLNSLHARPEDGPAARKLMDVALPVGEAEDYRHDDNDANTPLLAYQRSHLPLTGRRLDDTVDYSEEIDDEENPLPQVTHAEEEEEEEEEEDEDEEGEGRRQVFLNAERGVPIVANGVVFFRRIMFTDVPRF